MIQNIQVLFARLFTITFYIMSAVFFVSIFTSFYSGLMEGEEMTQLVIRSVNSGIIAIAVFEVGSVIDKEYGGTNDHDVIIMIRRTLPRFIGTVCIALSLEGLMMVIKYSQLDLAGNLYYPVAIIFSVAALLIGLGIFLKLAPSHQEGKPSKEVTQNDG